MQDAELFEKLLCTNLHPSEARLVLYHELQRRFDPQHDAAELTVSLAVAAARAAQTHRACTTVVSADALGVSSPPAMGPYRVPVALATLPKGPASPGGTLRGPFAGAARVVHVTATHALISWMFLLINEPQQPHQQDILDAAFRLLYKMLVQISRMQLEQNELPAAIQAISCILTFLDKPLVYLRDVVDNWFYVAPITERLSLSWQLQQQLLKPGSDAARRRDNQHRLKAMLLQRTNILSLIKFHMVKQDCATTAGFYLFAAYSQLWLNVAECMENLGKLITPDDAVYMLQKVICAIKRYKTQGNEIARNKGGGMWQPYTVICLSQLAHVLGYCANLCQHILIERPPEALGAALECLYDVVCQLPRDNCNTVDGIMLLSSLTHTTLQFAGAALAYRAYQGPLWLLKLMLRLSEALCDAAEDTNAAVLSGKLMELQVKVCLLWVVVIGGVQAPQARDAVYHSRAPDCATWALMWHMDPNLEHSVMRQFWQGMLEARFVPKLQALLKRPSGGPCYSHHPVGMLRTLSVLLVLRSRQDWQLAAARGSCFQQRVQYHAADMAALADFEQEILQEPGALDRLEEGSISPFLPTFIHHDRGDSVTIKYVLPSLGSTLSSSMSEMTVVNSGHSSYATCITT